MIIGIDLRCLPADGSPGAGVAHAAREIARALVLQSGPNVQWKLYVPRKASLGEFGDTHVRRINLWFAGGSSLRSALRSEPCDMLFCPSGAIPPGLSVPAVPWVHDVAIFDHPEWFGESRMRRALTTSLYRRGLLKSKKILAVSQQTKDEIVRLFGIDAERITVTHEGGDPVLASMHGGNLRDAKRRAKERLALRGITQPYVLFLGTVEPRKNLPLLLHAWVQSQVALGRPTDLVIAGRDGWKLGHIHETLSSTRVLAQESGSRIHRINAVSDDDRRDLLLAAEIVALPSLHEGFGLVALEAMQAETTVIASRAGALPEVIQDAGLLLPPNDVAVWSGALRGLLADDETHQHMAEQGKAQSQGMTWERAAKIAMVVLRG